MEMESVLVEPIPFVIKGMCILDGDGNRIHAKYYDKKVLATVKEQNAFEKTLFNETHRAASNTIRLNDLTIVYKRNDDLIFYVVGDAREQTDEPVLPSVLNRLYVSVSLILRENVEKCVALDHLDMISLAFDQICDEGIILEIDPSVVANCVGSSHVDVWHGEFNFFG